MSVSPDKALRDAWANVVRDLRPRVALLIGGVGVGKTWTVQGFYDEMAAGAQYWRPGLRPSAPPDQLSDVQEQRKRISNWNIVPEEHPSWMWFGTRCRPRFGLADVASTDFARTLQAHAEFLETPSRWRAVRRELVEAGVDFTANEIWPIIGRILFAAKTARGLWDAVRTPQRSEYTLDEVSTEAIQEIRAEARSSFTQLGKHVAGATPGSPTVVVLDDAHHASVEILSQVAALITDHDRLEPGYRYFNARQAAADVPILIILTVWPHTLAADAGEEPEIARWLDELSSAGVEVIPIDTYHGLSHSQAGVIAAETLPYLPQSLRDATVTPLVAATGISPYTLQIRISRIREAYPPGTLTEGEVNDLLDFIGRLPISPTDVFREQLRALPAASRLALAVGAQMGESFPVDAVINSLPDHSPGEVAQCIETAVKSGILQRSVDDGLPVFSEMLFTDELAVLYFADEAGPGGAYQRTARWVAPAIKQYLERAVTAYSLMVAPAAQLLAARGRVLKKAANALEAGTSSIQALVQIAVRNVTEADVDWSAIPDVLGDKQRWLDNSLSEEARSNLLFAALRTYPKDVRASLASIVSFHADYLASVKPASQILAEVTADTLFSQQLSVENIIAICRSTENNRMVADNCVRRMMETLPADQVIELLRDRLDTSPGTVTQVARELERVHGVVVAFKFTRDYLDREWPNVEARFGGIGIDIGAYREVADRLQPAIHRNLNAAVSVSTALMKLGNSDEAIRVLELHPDSLIAVQRLVQIHLQQGDLKTAQEVLRSTNLSHKSLAKWLKITDSSETATAAFRSISALSRYPGASSRPKQFGTALRLSDEALEKGRSTKRSCACSRPTGMTCICGSPAFCCSTVRTRVCPEGTQVTRRCHSIPRAAHVVSV